MLSGITCQFRYRNTLLHHFNFMLNISNKVKKDGYKVNYTGIFIVCTMWVVGMYIFIYRWSFCHDYKRFVLAFVGLMVNELLGTGNRGKSLTSYIQKEGGNKNYKNYWKLWEHNNPAGQYFI